MFKIGCAWDLSGGLGEPPMGAQTILLKPNLAVAYTDTWLSLLESLVWRCGTHVHAYSRRVAQLGAFHSLLLYLLHVSC